ncbi:MFS transporter [Parapedobacter sp. DT-150]|uniref:MFS transporter n=1 Tax=Parapedobacter sp. DT-150 TaxID=3396162 RepID=UPI003F1D576A
MNRNNASTNGTAAGKLFPILMTFAVMGFVDIVGVSTGYVQQDFKLDDQVAQLLPMMVFLWFFFLSIPAAMLQERIGKRNALQLGIVLTAIGVSLPFVRYSFPTMLIAFVVLGVGNTIVQVSANPLVQQMVSEKQLPGVLSFSQFLKAITSLAGPLITTFFAVQYGNWKLVFVIYGAVSLISWLWLYALPAQESKQAVISPKPTFRTVFSLLRDRYVLGMVLAIFLIVGADVGLNANIQRVLMSLHAYGLEQASYGISIYFTALVVSRFLGGIVLPYVSTTGFLVVTLFVALGGVLLLYFSPTGFWALAGIFTIGIGAGNLFPVIFAIVINRTPERASELSSLMVMAIVGGALIPPIMGLLNTQFGIGASIALLACCFGYVLGAVLWFRKVG